MNINLTYMLISFLTAMGLISSVAISIKNFDLIAMGYVIFYFLLISFLVYNLLSNQSTKSKPQNPNGDEK